MTARSDLFSLEQIGIKLGLEQITALLAALGRPDRSYRSIVVAGTNGKGSTTAMIERGLRAAGYRTGRYTSPHLVHIEERFAVNGVPIAAEAFDRAAAHVLEAASALRHPPSFFEATTALGLDVFREAEVDVAVLEVGLGGRLDATAAVDASAAVITRIDFDHEEYLGRTLEAIAGEKAGIIKPGQTVVLAENAEVAEAVVARHAADRGASLVRAWREISLASTVHEGLTELTLDTPVRRYDTLRVALRGQHQIQNVVTAVRTLEVLNAEGRYVVPADAVRVAVERVEWPARIEWRRTDRGTVLIDGAHNPGGASALATYLRDTFARQLPIVFGAMRDKDVGGMLTALVPSASHLILTAADSPRAAHPYDLSQIAARLAPHLPVIVEPAAACALARAHDLGDPVVVAGSLYLAGEIRSSL